MTSVKVMLRTEASGGRTSAPANPSKLGLKPEEEEEVRRGPMSSPACVTFDENNGDLHCKISGSSANRPVNRPLIHCHLISVNQYIKSIF